MSSTVFPHLYTLCSLTFYVNDVLCICRMVMNRKIFLVQFLKYDENKAKYKNSAIECEILGGVKWFFIKKKWIMLLIM
jgi:hypothetical protein